MGWAWRKAAEGSKEFVGYVGAEQVTEHPAGIGTMAGPPARGVRGAERDRRGNVERRAARRVLAMVVWCGGFEEVGGEDGFVAACEDGGDAIAWMLEK